MMTESHAFDPDSLAHLVRDAIQHAMILGRIAAKHDDHIRAMMTYLNVPTPHDCVSMTGLEEIMDRLWEDIRSRKEG